MLSNPAHLTTFYSLRATQDMPLDKNEANYAPTYLSINIKPAIRAVDAKHPMIGHLRPTNQMLIERAGNVTHRFEVDGTAAVCVRSSSASKERPLRFGLRVVKDDSINLLSASIHRADAAVGDGTSKVMRHLSFMAMDIQRVGFAMKNVLAEADFAKERDTVFHKQTQEMDEATVFWPVVQVCVLLMTGFAQASHIVRFFKSRRIL